MNSIREEFSGRLADHVACWASATPDATAIHFNGMHLSYNWLENRVREFCELFQNSGLTPGERCGIVLPNSADYVAIEIALQKAGCCPVLIYPHSAPAELLRCINHAQPGAIVIGSSALSGLLRDKEKLPPSLRLAFRADQMDDVLRLRESSARVVVSPPEHALICYTSGTSGTPKAAIISYDSLAWRIRENAEFFKITQKDRRLIASPLSYFGGRSLWYAHLSRGASIYILRQPFLPELIGRALQEYRISLLFAVPYTYACLLEKCDFNQYALPDLRAAVVSGAACPDKLKQMWRDRLPRVPLTSDYGTNELGPLFFAATDKARAKSYCIGRPSPRLSVKLAKDGELLVKTPYEWPGYFSSAGPVRDRLDREGWYHTGDICDIDPEGDYVFRGIKSDMINFCGNKVSPLEVEQVILEIPGVVNCKVFGWDAENMGQVVVAAVHASSGLSEEGIRNYCLTKLSRYKVPSEVVFVDPSVYTSSSKIEKDKVIQKLAQKRSKKGNS